MSNSSNTTSGTATLGSGNLIFGASEYADHVGARLLDFFADTTPWQRRLWDVGSVLVLDELAEAAEWSAKNVLSAGAVSWLARDVERLAGRDRAIGEKEIRQQLTAVLRSSLGAGSRQHRRLHQLTAMVREPYLDRWRNSLSTANHPSPERLSRAVAAHLLDVGYSMGHLHRWARGFIVGGASLPDLLTDAAILANGYDTSYEVLVPFQSLVGAGTNLTGSQSTWLDAAQVSGWLASHARGTTGVRQNGGFLYTVKAKDAQAAVSAVSSIVERLIARSSFAASGERLPRPEGNVWVGNHGPAFKMRPPARGAKVRSLVAESRLYDVVEKTALDDALELAAALNHGSPGPAIAGGWAAVEALLVSPADPDDAREGRGATAADRMAALIACSWPRAELTGLAHRHRPPQQDRISILLAAATTNRERSRIVADTLAAGNALTLSSPSDSAAQARMKKLVASQRPTLRDIQDHMRTAMRRLYRQRNIVMHGGATSALALEATLRTSAPLVGAGLDRITHAALTDDVDPLALADRAHLRLALAGSPDGAHIVDLLE